jgi:hypothetical protein
MTGHKPAGTRWRSYSATQGGCVDVASAPADVHVRDTKDRASGALTFGPAQWQAFLTSITRSRASARVRITADETYTELSEQRVIGG